jgi:hypothetical protein
VPTDPTVVISALPSRVRCRWRRRCDRRDWSARLIRSARTRKTEQLRTWGLHAVIRTTGRCTTTTQKGRGGTGWSISWDREPLRRSANSGDSPPRALSPAHRRSSMTRCMRWTPPAPRSDTIVRSCALLDRGADLARPQGNRQASGDQRTDHLRRPGGLRDGLDVDTGVERWRIRPNPHPGAAIFGSATLVGQNVAIGIASVEETLRRLSRIRVLHVPRLRRRPRPHRPPGCRGLSAGGGTRTLTPRGADTRLQLGRPLRERPSHAGSRLVRPRGGHSPAREVGRRRRREGGRAVATRPPNLRDLAERLCISSWRAIVRTGGQG